MEEEREKQNRVGAGRWSLTCVLGGGALLALSLAILLGSQTLAWYRARQLGRSSPALALIPHPLPDLAASQAPGSTVAEFGYELEVPWPKPEQVKRTQWLAVYIFPGRIGLIFCNPAEQRTAFDIMKQVVEEAGGRFRSYLGAQSAQSLLTSELNMTPDQVSPFMSRYNAARASMLLSFKQLVVPSKASAIYSFERNGFHGYQLGDPSREQRVEILCFDSSDRQLRFDISWKRESGAGVTQQDINRLLQTLHIVAADPKQSTATP